MTLIVRKRFEKLKFKANKLRKLIQNFPFQGRLTRWKLSFAYELNCRPYSPAKGMPPNMPGRKFSFSFSLNQRSNYFSLICRVVERELSVPLPISKIIKKWNNLLQEYKVRHQINLLKRKTLIHRKNGQRHGKLRNI